MTSPDAPVAKPKGGRPPTSADIVDDEQSLTAEADEIGLQRSGVVRIGESRHPLLAVANSTR